MNKVYELSEAIRKFVHDGDEIYIGGFTTNRKPYAAVCEILRQGQKDFILHSGPAGGDNDMLIGAGRVKVLNNSYVGNSGYTNIGRRFRETIEKGGIMFEDYSLDAQSLMFHAGALGFPYVPIRYLLGSSMETNWGISEEVRKTMEKLTDKKLIVAENPFNPGEKVVLVPAIRPDVTIIHVQKASPNGCVRIEGSRFVDVDAAMAAKHCIVTCEELVPEEVLREGSDENTIPGFTISAVVHVPYGAHPSQCYNYYDYDGDMYWEYDKASKTQEDFDQFLEKWVYGVKDHKGYMDKVGASRTIALKVTHGLGFAAK